MKLIGLGAVLAGALWAGAAMAQDVPPPGCRWQEYSGETTLACKDGKGNWRRSGDDLIIGTYPMSKPKPVAATKPATSAATPAAATAPATKAAEDVAQPALEEGAAAPGAEAAAPSAADAAVDASAGPADQAAAPPPAEPPGKPWWRAIWDAIVNFLRSIGLLK